MKAYSMSAAFTRGVLDETSDTLYYTNVFGATMSAESGFLFDYASNNATFGHQDCAA